MTETSAPSAPPAPVLDHCCVCGKELWVHPEIAGCLNSTARTAPSRNPLVRPVARKIVTGSAVIARVAWRDGLLRKVDQ